MLRAIGAELSRPTMDIDLLGRASSDHAALRKFIEDCAAIEVADGMVFDSSVERGEPASFGVNKVISGWTEALQLMPKGAKYQLFVPQELGYGDRGVGSDIPPFATLIFDVELLEIEK